MKISNFQYIGKTGNSVLDEIHHATVDITTGIFRKKTETVRVFCNHIDWKFADTGAFTPEEVKKLFWAYKARKAMP